MQEIFYPILQARNPTSAKCKELPGMELYLRSKRETGRSIFMHEMEVLSAGTGLFTIYRHANDC